MKLLSTRPTRNRVVQQTPAPRVKKQAQRPLWRERLVDAERGFSQSIRRDSGFFVQGFSSCVILATAFILQISMIESLLIILALAIVFSAEMFHQVLKAIWHAIGHHLDKQTSQAVKMGTAAVFTVYIGAGLVIGTIFANNIWTLVYG